MKRALPGPEWTPVLVVLAALACLLGIMLVNNLAGLLALGVVLIACGIYGYLHEW